MDLNPTSAREKLLVAALKLIRTKGYGATTVDDLCGDAGVTKGAFFHHFKSKEDAAIEATRFWTQVDGRTCSAMRTITSMKTRWTR